MPNPWKSWPRVSTSSLEASAQGKLDGQGSATRFNGSQCVVADTAGNLFVADTKHHLIRKATPQGVVSIFASDPTKPGGGFADSYNHCIRKIMTAGLVSTEVGTPSRRGALPGALPGSMYLPYALAVTPKGDVLVGMGNVYALFQATLH